MAVQAIVFTFMFRRNIEHFSAYLIAGNVLFGFLRESSGHSMTSITGNAALLKKTYVPKYIFTLSKVTSDLINLFFSFGALIIVIICTGVRFTPYMLLFWIPILELYIFCVGLGLFLAQLSVFFRDVQYIWNALTMAWMYLTPVFYPIDLLPDTAQWLIMRFNPMFYYITMFRDLVIYGSFPWTPLIWRGGLIAVLTLLMGAWCFKHNKEKFVLYI
jgi:lipopolysaccharide transport system permease protein